MDYRSAIQISLENNKKALKKVRQVSDGSGGATKKCGGPSDEAVKNFLLKKKEKEMEWLNKLKVAKPKDATSNSKKTKSKTSKVDGHDDAKDSNRNKEKSSSLPSNGLPKKTEVKQMKERSSVTSNGLPKNSEVKQMKGKSSVTHSDLSKKSVVKQSRENLSNDSDFATKQEGRSGKDKRSCDPPKKDPAKKTDGTKAPFVPSFSKYADLLALANRNATNPSEFWIDPFDADRKETVKKKQPLVEDISAHLPVSKKRKLNRTEDGAPQKKQTKKSDAAGAVCHSRAAVEAPKPSPSKAASQQCADRSMPPPMRRGIAAQLSTSQAPPFKPKSAVAKAVSPPSRPHSKEVRPRSDPRPAPSTMERTPSGNSRGGIAAQNSRPPVKAAPQPEMSVTMEDADSNFMHFSRKYDVQPHCPPPPAPAPRRGGGIASQNARPFSGPVKKTSGFRFSETSDMEDEEDEYDEEDDFIDDSDLVSENQYKNVVAEIHRSLRFDPNKYEKVTKFDDLRSMESNYKDIEKEEKRSARLGMREDLEDIRAEQERMKKKMKKLK